MTAAVAGVAGLAVGTVTLYLARLLVARERVHRRPPGGRVAAEERAGPEDG